MTTPASQTTPASPLTALARRWWLALALPLVLAVVGYLLGAAKAPVYTAEARTSVGMGTISDGQIAGFSTATQEQAANYARWVNDRGVSGKGDVPEGTEVSASPIPDSNVIRVEAKGADREAVVRAAQKAADDLVRTVNTRKGDSDPAVTLGKINAIGAQWGAAKASADGADTAAGVARGKGTDRAAIVRTAQAAALAHSKEAVLRIQLDALGQKYQQQIAEGSQAANLLVVKPAALTQSTRAANQQRYALAGLVLGLGLALALATLLERRRAAAARAASPEDDRHDTLPGNVVSVTDRGAAGATRDDRA